MSDIYNIPGDNHKTYRLEKFVEYQHEAASINERFMGEWIKRHGVDKDRAVNMCWLMLVTYNELTCILLDAMLDKYSPEEIWNKYKPLLNFGSARKYAKNNDQFCDLMNEWRALTDNHHFKWLIRHEKPSGVLTCKSIQSEVERVVYVGRFASDLFLEAVVYIRDYLGINITFPETKDWKNCANLTSGIYNIFYEDERANEFDKTKKVTPMEERYLDKKIQVIQKAIQETYPDQPSEIQDFIGKICSFRNLFKNARYGGFHHDRQLGVLRQYEKDFPDYQYLWDDCYKLRFDMFPHKFLGELNGWEGIRPERKKLWLSTGRTGVEDE